MIKAEVAKFFAGWVVAVLFALMTATPGHALETIAFDQANPPFMYQDNGQARGLYPAIIAEAFRRMGVGVRLLAFPWLRARQGADAGVWGLGGLYMNTARLETYDYSEPIFEERLLLYVLRGQEFPFSEVGDLTGKRIGVMRGWSYGNGFDHAVAGGRILADPVANDQANIGRLLLGRVDAIVITAESLALLRDRLDPGNRLVALPRPLAANLTYLSFPKSKNLVPLLERFNKELQAMRRDGSWDRICRAHLR